MLGLMVSFGGCAPNHTFIKTGFGEKKQPLPGDCEIFVLSNNPKDLDYEEIGICNAQAPGKNLPTQKMIAELIDPAVLGFILVDNWYSLVVVIFVLLIYLFYRDMTNL